MVASQPPAPTVPKVASLPDMQLDGNFAVWTRGHRRFGTPHIHFPAQGQTEGKHWVTISSGVKGLRVHLH